MNAGRKVIRTVEDSSNRNGGGTSRQAIVKGGETNHLTTIFSEEFTIDKEKMQTAQNRIGEANNKRSQEGGTAYSSLIGHGEEEKITPPPTPPPPPPHIGSAGGRETGEEKTVGEGE